MSNFSNLSMEKSIRKPRFQTVSDDRSKRKKRLLLGFADDDVVISRAINCLGNREELVAFIHRGRRGYSDIRDICFETSDYEEMHRQYSPVFENECFDEVYLSVVGTEKNIDRMISFMENLPIQVKKIILNDKLPQCTLKEAIDFRNIDWVKQAEDSRGISQEVPIYVVIGVYNEEDIIYATVKNAFMQGCQKVLIVDNASTDNTVGEALSAGAELICSFKTEEYDELLRVRIMNDVVEEISMQSSHDAIWWLLLDADEFPQGPKGNTIKEFLLSLPSDVRVVGSKQINHFPVDRPYYIPRLHPFDFMPYGEEYEGRRLLYPHCPAWHWKHPLLKYEKGKPSVRAKTGFHMCYCSEILVEAKRPIETHHFPFRDKEKTYERYFSLCGLKGLGRNKLNDQRSVQCKSCITKRFENLDHIYNRRWGMVDVYPVWESRKRKLGVNLKKYKSFGMAW